MTEVERFSCTVAPCQQLHPQLTTLHTYFVPVIYKSIQYNGSMQAYGAQKIPVRHYAPFTRKGNLPALC